LKQEAGDALNPLPFAPLKRGYQQRVQYPLYETPLDDVRNEQHTQRKEPMARMTKEEKRLEKEFDAAFKKLGDCIQFDMFDLSKIHSEAIRAAKDIGMEWAVASAIAKYRKN
jgi:hypothetical protein